jgi:putative membrane protein
MSLIAKVLVGLIAVEHIYILCLEMFLWTTPRTMKAFGTTAQFAEDTKTLAANQGLYNGFLAAGLIWSLAAAPDIGRQVALFFVSCVLVAGVYGGLTATSRILLIQALPALLALIALMLTKA